MREVTIISGFSGIGKTTAAKEFKACLDLESSNFSKDKNEWPFNYVDAIEEAMDDVEVDIILVSCHQEVRDEMVKRGIPFVIVGPDFTQKNEYLRRWFLRGSEVKFIEKMNAQWDIMLKSCQNGYTPYIYLARGEYLSDFLTNMKGIQSVF